MIKDVFLKLIVSAISNEKGISEEIVFDAIRDALIIAIKKKYGFDINFNVKIDKDSGFYSIYRVWHVVEYVEDNSFKTHITLENAKKINPNVKVGDFIEEYIKSVKFGRIETQMAKHVILKKVRDAERLLVFKEYSLKVGKLLTSIVKKILKDCLILDFGNNVEGILKKDKLLLNESFKIGEKIRVYLEDINKSAVGPQLVLTRISDKMLIELFKIEIPEVSSNVIEIKSLAREPGIRSKIAVKTNDSRLDAVGACVGIRGSRIQAISNELNDERIDVILWDQDPAQFVMNSMAPAEISSIIVNYEMHSMELAVSKSTLSQTIGKNGQNVRLASILTSWDLKVVNIDESNKRDLDEFNICKLLFINNLNISSIISEALVNYGFTSLEEISYVPKDEMLKIKQLDNNLIDVLKNTARVILKNKNKENLYLCKNLNKNLFNILYNNNIRNREDLANLSVDDLISMANISKEEAAKIIINARSHWFNN